MFLLCSRVCPERRPTAMRLVPLLAPARRAAPAAPLSSEAGSKRPGKLVGKHDGKAIGAYPRRICPERPRPQPPASGRAGPSSRRPFPPHDLSERHRHRPTAAVVPRRMRERRRARTDRRPVCPNATRTAQQQRSRLLQTHLSAAAAPVPPATGFVRMAPALPNNSDHGSSQAKCPNAAAAPVPPAAEFVRTAPAPPNGSGRGSSQAKCPSATAAPVPPATRFVRMPPAAPVLGGISRRGPPLSEHADRNRTPRAAPQCPPHRALFVRIARMPRTHPSRPNASGVAGPVRSLIGTYMPLLRSPSGTV